MLFVAAGLIATSSTAAPAEIASPSSVRARSSEAVAQAAIDDIQGWWASTLPDVYGQRYEPIPADRLFPYSSDDPPPACGRDGRTPYEEIVGNAFYCPADDFVAWDAEQLLPRLQQRYGDFAVSLVLAHEWGHVAQARSDTTIRATIYLEQQADCFAGAWARHVERGHDTSLELQTGDLDAALGGYLEFRDPPGVDPSNGGAHGNAFDRVSAFQDGFEQGADRCATYEHDPPPVTESPFTSYEDQATGGDVPLADAIDLVHTDLDDFWAIELDGSSPVTDVVVGRAGCTGATDGGVLVDGVSYCAESDKVSYDRQVLEGIYVKSGDFGAGMVLAAAWSSATQHELGLSIAGSDARLRADCLTGAWAGDVARGDRNRGTRGSGGSQLSLSPGDLDEGIATFVAYGGRDDERGSAFSRVAAFRKGFFGTVKSCTR